MKSSSSFKGYIQKIFHNAEHQSLSVIAEKVDHLVSRFLAPCHQAKPIYHFLAQHWRKKQSIILGGGLCFILQTPAFAEHIIGADSSSVDNPFVQSVDPALSGGNRNQSLNNGDFLLGTFRSDIIEGRLGVDVLNGLLGDDILIGGLEHFTGEDQRTDRAFGGRGNDMFLWKPGDGTDLFDGGPGIDVVVLGIVGEPSANDPSQAEFLVLDDNQAGEVFIDPQTELPLIDVSNSPGFCPIVDASSEIQNANGETINASAALEELGIDHLAQFVLRGVRNNFESGVQSNDNGLRVSLHLKDVEFVVCASRDGTEVELIDLRRSPVVKRSIENIRPLSLRRKLQQMVL